MWGDQAKKACGMSTNIFVVKAMVSCIAILADQGGLDF
jgi:hypothetical protein